MKRSSLFTLILFLYITLLNSFASDKLLNITFVSPNPNDNDFWGITHNFARAAAKDLDINLTIVYTKTGRYSYAKTFNEVCQSKKNQTSLLVYFYVLFHKIS